jgi:hypothetical protein
VIERRQRERERERDTRITATPDLPAAEERAKIVSAE